MYAQDDFIRRIAKAAYPSYNGRKFRLEPFHAPMRLDSYWSEGSRDYYVVLNLETLQTVSVPQNGTPFDPATLSAGTLPENFAVIQHTIERGRDLGITIYVRPDQLTPMLPAPVELSGDERIVLEYTCRLKSSYSGIKNYRFAEASRETGITTDRWEVAKASLIGRKLLNAAGAATDAGRNARSRKSA